MFERRKANAPGAADDNRLEYETETQQPIAPEWDEVYAELNAENDGYDISAEDELVEHIDAAEDEGIFIDEQSFAPAEFPALRMAFEIADPSEKEQTDADQYADLPEYIAESDGEDGLTQLIMRHARLAEQEEALQLEETPQPAEDVPELFRLPPESAQTASDKNEENQSDEEFTMASELQKQRQISGELFDYIDTINSDALNLIQEREQRKIIRHNRPYDPYNLNFNNRFYDREEVLESTPEIELSPKYELRGGNE